MDQGLITTIIASIVAAFVFGWAAKYLKLPVLIGYLLAGVLIGPHTPGFVANVGLANQLAEIGIILLMFEVGLHFSLTDLKQSYHIAVPGAVMQILIATLVGAALSGGLGYSLPASIIFGFALSVASTAVLLRAFTQRDLLETRCGKIAISWLIVEDICMVFALVLLPVFAQMLSQSTPASPVTVMLSLAEVTAKIAGFFGFMYLIGRRLMPWALKHASALRSAELDTLCTLAIALGFAAIAHEFFNTSLALGAFLAGVMLNESQQGRQAASHASQLRDTFSVLFFVSVGMLFDPRTLLEHPLAVAATLAVIVVAKGVVALAITKLFRLPRIDAYPIAIGLAQIGEFSFILGGLGMASGLIDQFLYDLMLAGAMLSIGLNHFLFRAYDRLLKRNALSR